MKKSLTLKFIALFILASVMLTAFSGCDMLSFLLGFESSSESSESSESSAPESSTPSSSGSSQSSSQSSSHISFPSSLPEISINSQPEDTSKEDFVNEIATHHGKNKDTVGWLSVPGTDIYDAVVQGKDNDYYLRKNNLGKYDYDGCYFADYESAMGDRNQLSRNTIIYGHNLGYLGVLKDDARSEKFGPLFNFLDEEFVESHPYIYFSTAEEDMVWEVFAVYYTEAAMGSYNPQFKFNLVNVSDSYFEYMIDESLKRSIWDYGIEPSVDDKILTLSTCSYKYGTVRINGTLEMKTRFNVVARLVEDDVVLDPTVDVERNTNVKEPILPNSYK